MSKRVVLTLFVIGMLLSLVVQNAGKTTGTVKGNRSLKSDSSALIYDNVTTHDGDLVINGTQTFVIENCTYIQTGNIEVKDNARLFIKNAEIHTNQSYLGQFRIAFLDYSEVEVDNALITSWWCGWSVQDNANLSVKTSIMRDDYFTVSGHSTLMLVGSHVHEVSCGPGSSTFILNSFIEVRMTLRFDSDSNALISGLNPGLIMYWSLQANETVTQGTYDVIINNTAVASWALSLDFTTNVWVSDSVLSLVFLCFPNTVANVDNLEPGYISSWSMNRISLSRTYLAVWIISFWNSRLNISNSQVEVLMYDSSRARAANSTTL